MTNQEAAITLTKLYTNYALLCSTRSCKPNKEEPEAITLAIQALNKEEKLSQWNQNEKGEVYCRNCGAVIGVGIDTKFSDVIKGEHYCYNCGARMEIN